MNRPTWAVFYRVTNMADRLNFIASPGAQTKSAPRVVTSNMGDGYDERKADGLNIDLKEYTLTYNIPKKSVADFRDFMDSKKGYIAFEIMSPSKRAWVLVVCSTWSETTHNHYSTFNLTCQEVVK